MNDDRDASEKLIAAKIYANMEQLKKNNDKSALEELSAWYEWKKWCSVLRVFSPQPMEDEIAAGLVDDICPTERRKLYKRLRYCICSPIYAFNAEKNHTNWDSRYNDDNESCQDKSQGEDFFVSDEDECYQDTENSRQKTAKNGNERPPWFDDPFNDFISCFDTYMQGEKKEKPGDFINSGRTSYKDFIFYLVENSDDPPLKVIRGKIMSSDCGYILTILKKYYQENNSAADICAPSQFEYEVLHKFVSLDEPINENDSESLTYGELFCKKEKSVIEETEILNICEQLTKVEKVLILAEDSGIVPDTPEVKQFTGLQKTTLYDRQKVLFGPDGKLFQMLKEFQRDYEMNDILRKLKNQIKISLRAEKGAESFLTLVERKLQMSKQEKEVYDE